jgi:3-dehydroquinate synthase
VSEGIKVGLIKDAAFYKFIEQNSGGMVRRDMPVMQKLIHRWC